MADKTKVAPSPRPASPPAGRRLAQPKPARTPVGRSPVAGHQPVGRQAGIAAPPQPGPAAQGALLNRSGGQPLPSATRSAMERSLGADLGDVRVHTGGQAARAANELSAAAFTSGQDIYFGAGQYRPGAQAGRALLAHELTHTLQQSAEAAPHPAPDSTQMTVSQPGDASEREASAVASRVAAGQPVDWRTINSAPGAIGRQLARQPAGAPVAPAPTPVAPAPPATAAPSPAGAAVPAAAASGIPAEAVTLDGPSFAPPAAVSEYLDAQRNDTGSVHVAFRTLARGDIEVRKRRDSFETPGNEHQAVPLTHPALRPLVDAGIQPVLAVRIRNSAISGYVTLPTRRGAAGNPQAVVTWIKEHPAELGWAGIDVSRIPTVTNELKDGVLRLQLTEFPVKVGGFVDGTASFGLENDVVTFSANGTVHVQGLTDAQLAISRDEQGQLSGQVEVPVSIANFSGNILAVYGNGTVNVEGTVRYTTEKLTGEVTLLVTDAATARSVALQRLGPDAVAASAQEAQGDGGRAPRPGQRALAGWGVLDFAFTEWMTGRAQVIIDNEGHVTVVGEITPPAEIELFPQRDIVRNLFRVEARATYGVPLVGNIFLFANVGMDALAKLGPGKIYNIRVEGTYSTDPQVFNRFSIQASLNISAFAGLRLRAEGGAGVELLGHDIKAGAGINGLAGVRGYVEATPTFGYREREDPAAGRQGEFYIKGHMELAAQPFLGLSGDLFVELDSPWWSPAPDKKWTWPLGEVEYPLPGQFGLGADVDYVIGSDQLPEIQFGEVDFSKDKFMSDLMNDHVPPKSAGEQEKLGDWKQDETAGQGEQPPKVVDTQGAPAADQPAQGQQQPGEGQPPAPGVEQRWLRGMQALGEIAERSKSDPFTEAEIRAAVVPLREQFGFSELAPKKVGEDWRVHAAMNPAGDVMVEGEEAKPDEAEQAQAGVTPPTPTPVGTTPPPPALTPTPSPTAPKGKTRSDPIPMVWYKPPGLYPVSLDLGGDRYFFNEPTPLPVPDVSRLSDVRRSAFTSGEIVIGINTGGKYYPEIGKVWPRVRSGAVRTGVKQANYRALLRAHGYNWGSQEADHVRDLQWAGDDDYPNLWPLERTYNNAANRILRQMVTYLDDTGAVQAVRLEDTPLNRYFEIIDIQPP